jgi:hypothetical protein
MTLTDTILRDEVEETSTIPRPCRHVGQPTGTRAKEKCDKQAAFLPVYRCSIFRLCSPFGHLEDSDLIHPCPDCPEYRP